MKLKTKIGKFECKEKKKTTKNSKRTHNRTSNNVKADEVRPYKVVIFVMLLV